MKKIYVSFVVLMIATICFSQNSLSSDYSYNVSAPYKVYDANSKYYFAKGIESVSLKFDKTDVLIQKFNNEKPSFVKQTLLEKFFPKNYRIESVLEFKDKVFVFYSSWNGKDDKEQLFAVEVDFEKATLSTNHKLIVAINGKITGKSSFSFFGGGLYSMIAGTQDKFDFMLSYDKTNMLVQYVKKPEVKNDKKSYNVIGLIAFDENLKEVSNREVKMPYTERRMDNLDYQLDNEGNMYLLTKVYHDDSNDDKKRSKDELANYHIELLYLKNNSSEIITSKFENKNKFVNRLWMFDSAKDYLVCGGFFSNGKGDELSDSDGVLAFKIDKTGKIYDETFHSIPVELINQYESEKTKKKNAKKEEKGIEAKIPDLELRDLIVNEDGSFVLIGEQYTVVEHTSFSANGGSRTYFTYHYNDLLVSKIGVNGELNWMNKIPKSQGGGRGKGGMSYKYFNAKNHHYLVFLDNVKNIDLPIDKTPSGHRDGMGGYLTAVKVADEDGAISKSSIFNGRDIEDFQMHQFSVDRVFKTSENSFMLEVYKKKKEDVMIRVTLK